LKSTLDCLLRTAPLLESRRKLFKLGRRGIFCPLVLSGVSDTTSLLPSPDANDRTDSVESSLGKGGFGVSSTSSSSGKVSLTFLLLEEFLDLCFFSSLCDDFFDDFLLFFGLLAVDGFRTGLIDSSASLSVTIIDTLLVAATLKLLASLGEYLFVAGSLYRF
jgi:hypothetical protein